MDDYRDPYVDVYKRFEVDVENHGMTIAHDDGLYRHIRFRPTGDRPSFYWFDLITWPGVLVFNGDMGSWMFSRVTDMFTFFNPDSYINPGYWGEKLQASSGYKKFSGEKLREYVKSHVDDHPTVIEMTDDERAALWRDIETDIFDVAMDTTSAHTALTEFVFRAPKKVRPRDVQPGDRAWPQGRPRTIGSLKGSLRVLRTEWDQVWLIGDRGSSYSVDRNSTYTYTREDQVVFEFVDSWDWDLTDFTFQYLWACRAIQWSITAYRRGYTPHDAPEVEKESQQA